MAGVYLHVPFCSSHCPYCDFYVVTRQEEAIPNFVDAICREIELSSARRAVSPHGMSHRRGGLRPSTSQVASIYFGGGTPGLLTPVQVARILAALRDSFYVIADAQITLEANPDRLTIDRLRGFREAGVNRLSLGIQSFHDSELKRLGREHTRDDAVRSFVLARDAGFTNINIDIIYAIPGQIELTLSQTLEEVRALRPEHISVYGLTFDPGTPFGRALKSGEISAMPENEEASLARLISVRLQKWGYERYEITNYARNGHYSRYLMTCWNGGCYFGFGPAAHSYDGSTRWWNVRSLKRYLAVVREGEEPAAGRETLASEQRRFERILLGLRTCKGIDISQFEADFGLDFRETYREALETLAALAEERGVALIALSDGHLRLTEEGALLCDAISRVFAK